MGEGTPVPSCLGARVGAGAFVWVGVGKCVGVGAGVPSSQDASDGFVVGVGIVFGIGANPGVAAIFLVGSEAVVIVPFVCPVANANWGRLGLCRSKPNGDGEDPNGELAGPNGEGPGARIKEKGAVLDVGGSGPCGPGVAGVVLSGGGGGACCL